MVNCIVGTEAGAKLLSNLRSANFEVKIATAFIDDYGVSIIEELAKRGVKVTLLLPKRTVDGSILSKLVQLPNVEVYLANEFVHAKLYLIDGKAYTSSANLTKPALTGQNIETSLRGRIQHHI